MLEIDQEALRVEATEIVLSFLQSYAPQLAQRAPTLPALLVKRLEGTLGRLAMAHVAAELEAAQADRNLTRSELDDIAEALRLPKDAPGCHGAVLERVRELARGTDQLTLGS